MEPNDFYELEQGNATPEILLQTKLQIEKDFGLTGFTYPWNETPKDLPALVPELTEKIEALKNGDSSTLMKVVYRVDLTERQYKKVSAMPGNWSENLAKAIVLREFQKVVIRRNFSS